MEISGTCIEKDSKIFKEKRLIAERQAKPEVKVDVKMFSTQPKAVTRNRVHVHYIAEALLFKL